jgi:hypothetical protein
MNRVISLRCYFFVVISACSIAHIMRANERIGAEKNNTYNKQGTQQKTKMVPKYKDYPQTLPPTPPTSLQAQPTYPQHDSTETAPRENEIVPMPDR